MENEFKAVGSLLPTLQRPATNVPLCDILTDAEKQQAIEWATDNAKKRYVRSMQEKGLNEHMILQKLSEKDWTAEVDCEKVLADANQRKHWAQENQQRKDEEIRQREENRKKIIQKHNAAYFYLLVKRFFILNYGRFIYDDTNSHYIESVCYFLSEDPRFETKLGYSFNKGLMILGDSGLGKTKVIEAVSQNERHPITIYSMIDISEQVRKNGEAELNTNRMILLDDVGTEEESIKHYGTQINWFKDFIETYYLKHKTYSGLLITTNCGGEELERKYGYRVRSRLREMMNLIELQGKDLRK